MTFWKFFAACSSSIMLALDQQKPLLHPWLMLIIKNVLAHIELNFSALGSAECLFKFSVQWDINFVNHPTLNGG